MVWTVSRNKETAGKMRRRWVCEDLTKLPLFCVYLSLLFFFYLILNKHKVAYDFLINKN